MFSLVDLWTNNEAANSIVAITIAFISGVVSPIIASWAKAKFAAKKIENIEEEETDEILKMLKANELVDERIENIRAEYDFDRVWIAQFHNGGSFYPSDKVLNKFQKFSLTYEACKNNISSELSTVQNVPVTVFTSILRKVKEDGYFGIDNVYEALDTSMSLKPFWCERGIKSFMIVAIKSLDKRFLGFMVVDMVTQVKPFTEEIIKNLVVESKILGGYLVRENT
jgi:hypothetical protein